MTETKTLFFDQSLNKLNVLFKFSGMNLQRQIKTTSDMIKHRWLFSVNFLWVLSAAIASVYYIYLGIVRGMDVIELTNIAPCTTFSTLAVLKSFFHLFNEADILKLLEIMRKLERDENKREPSAEKYKIATEDIQFLNQVLNVLYVLNVSMLIVFDMIPIILIAVTYHKTGEFKMLLPYLDVFAFVPYEFMYWSFAYVHQIWSECIVIKTTSDMIKHRWLFSVNFLWVLSAAIASVYYIYLGIVRGMDVIELTNIAPCTTFSTLAVLKSFFHLFNEADILKLLEIMRKLERDENKREPSAEKYKIATEDIQFLNQVLNVLYVLNVSMLIVFDMIPIILIAVTYHKTGEFKMLLPYLDVFAFVPYEFMYWSFAYVHQIWSECIVLLEMGAVDGLFFTCCTYIRTQFRLLQHDIESLIPAKTEEISEIELHAKLSEYVKWHQGIIESSQILEKIYSKSNLVNFMTSSFIICLTGFNVTIVEDITVAITFVTFLFMSLTQVFLLCFFADLLMTASKNVSDAVYNSRWYSTSVQTARGLLLVQTRSQEPCRLTAAGFADVNLNAFMRVLSTSWSYFALLQTMYGGDTM